MDNVNSNSTQENNKQILFIGCNNAIIDKYISELKGEITSFDDISDVIELSNDNDLHNSFKILYL